MLSQQTKAIIINIRDYGESDKIVTFYTLNSGKLTAIAKGAKKSKKRFLNRLELFSLVDIQMTTRQRSSMALLEQADTIDRFGNIHQDYARYTAAQLICELLLLWTSEKDPDQNLFNNLIWVFNGLNKGSTVPDTFILFHIRMLALLGYQPAITTCISCGTFKTKNAPFAFVPGRNAILCNTCTQGSSPQRTMLSINTIKLLSKAQELPLDKLERFRFSKTSIRESLAMLHSYGIWLLQKEIHSWPIFMKAIGLSIN